MKKILIVAGVVVVIVILAIVAVPFFLSADAYKDQILSRVRDATGRDMTIGGPLSLSLFPDVRVEASDVVLANAPGAASPAMAKLKKLDVAVKLIPLLSGRFEVERLSLVDPRIELEIDANGRPSWSFAESAAALPAPAPGAVPPKNPSMMGLAALSRLAVKDVSISNGDIVLLDRRTNQREELTDVALTVSAPSLDAPFTMSGSATWRGQKVTIAAKLDNTGALVRAGGKSGLTLSLNAKPIALKLAGSVANTGDGDRGGLVFDGTADLSAASVRDLVTWSGRPIALPKRGLGALALSGKVHAENGIAKFSDANFSLDGIKAEGALTLDATHARPAVSGTLHASAMDLNPYLPPPVPGWSSDPFEV
ncbi:MAG: AsmA family protein, partial [Stellaceae bacterium]